MPLRPRYSLLTLLVLTALVASGVKLWRGPHRVTVGDPQSAVEQDLFARAKANYLWCVPEYEYVYRNSWSGPEFLALVGSFTPPDWTLHIPEHDAENRMGLDAWRFDPQQMKFAPAKKYQPTVIRRMVYAGKSLREPPSPQKFADGVPLFEDCYLICEHGNIYRFHGCWMFANLDQLEIAEVTDEDAREMLAAELARLSHATR